MAQFLFHFVRFPFKTKKNRFETKPKIYLIISAWQMINVGRRVVAAAWSFYFIFYFFVTNF